MIPESDDSFTQVSIGAYKLATMIKVSEELLADSVFNLESYIAKEFARRVGNKEEAAFFAGDGTGKPLGILAATGGAQLGVTTAGQSAVTFDEVTCSPKRSAPEWSSSGIRLKATARSLLWRSAVL